MINRSQTQTPIERRVAVARAGEYSEVKDPDLELEEQGKQNIWIDGTITEGYYLCHYAQKHSVMNTLSHWL